MRRPGPDELPKGPNGRHGWPWAVQDVTASAIDNDERLWPEMSVIIPSYNQGLFIEEAIRSVLLQGYPKLQCIVIDGGSTDETVEILRKYDAWLDFWVSEPDRGQSHGINKGVCRARGDILFWLNSDDLVLPAAFLKVADIFCKNPSAKMVVGQAQIINSLGVTTGTFVNRFSSWSDFVTRKCTIRQISTFFSRPLFDELGMIDESLDYCMDRELLIRFTEKTAPLVTDSFLAAYRDHEGTKFDHNWIRGYEEQDQMILRKLAGSDLEIRYLHWSTKNWFAMCIRKNFTIKDRLSCLTHLLGNIRALF